MDIQQSKRKPNWNEAELHALTQSVAENISLLQGKFSLSVTSDAKKKCWMEICERVNATSTTQRELYEVKKKWQDIRSIAKKKEAARVKSTRQTGGGPAPEDNCKSWEQIVIGTLSKSMVEGVDGGVDTSMQVSNQTDYYVQSASTCALSIPATGLLCETASVPIVTQDEPTETSSIGNESSDEKRRTKRSYTSNNGDVQEAFFSLEKEKYEGKKKYHQMKLEYMERMVKYQEEMLSLQMRSTRALESIAATVGLQSESCLSPIIKF